MILKSFLVLSRLLPKKKATKMCRGWTTEVHWQPGDSPKWFYCKRLTDGHTSYFPRTCSGRRSGETILVGIRPRSQLVPRGAGRREWIRFGKRRGRPLDGGDAGAPIHNEFLCHSSAVLGTGGVQTRRQQPEISKPKPTTHRSPNCSVTNHSLTPKTTRAPQDIMKLILSLCCHILA